MQTTRATFWGGRRVAMTGATGFVGFHLARQLRAAGAQVLALVRPTSDCVRLRALGVECVVADLLDAKRVAEVCRGREVLFHLAGVVDFESDWERFRLGNVEATRGVVDGARLAGVRRVVHTSTIAAVGGATTPTILDETATWNLGQLELPYITTKRQAEELALASNSNLEVVVVNPASVVGPDDFTCSEYGTLCRRFWRGRVPLYFAGGTNYVDVRDVAHGHLLAAELGRPGERYVLGGENHTYKSFFGELARLSNRRIFRVCMPRLVGGIIVSLARCFPRKQGKRAYLTEGNVRGIGWYFFVDSSKARRELGYEPRPLLISLQDTHAFWMKGLQPQEIIPHAA